MELERAHFIANRDVRVVGGLHNYGVNLRILLRYLPGVVDYYGGAIPGTINLNHIIRSNADFSMMHRVGEAMRNCLHVLLGSLARNIDRSETPSIDTMSWLEQNFAGTFYVNAMRVAARANGQSYVHEQSLARFTALAIISQLMRSDRLYALLGQFFGKHAKTLFYNEHKAMAGFRWCKCIIRYLPDAHRAACLRELVLNCPDIINELRVVAYERSSDEARICINNLRAVIDKMKENDRRRLRRDPDDIFEQRGRRRIRDDWWDDDDEAPFRLERRISTSPVRRRRLLIEETPRMYDDDVDDILRELGQGVRRRRALSLTGEQRLRRLENKVDLIQETVEWLGEGEMAGVGRARGLRAIDRRRSALLLE